MKKILVISEIFHPEQGLVNDFVRAVKDAGFDVEVLTRHPSYPLGKVFDGYGNEYYRKDSWDGITVHRFRVTEGYRESLKKKILNYVSFVRIGSKIGKSIGRDFDHVVVYQTGPLTVALPGVAIKKKYGTPLTVWTFDIWPDVVYAYKFPKIFPFTALLNHIVRKVYRNADNILVSSKMFEGAIKRYAPDKRVIYAPNWSISEPQEPCGLNLGDDCLNITFAGNISTAQNLEKVLAGWKLAGLQGCTLHIVGDGSKLDHLKDLAADKQIANVKFHGRYPSCQIADLLRRSDILLLPLIKGKGIEKTEPFKIQSYLKAGKPIFGVISGAGKDIIEGNGLGVCADPDDVNDIAAGFRKSVVFARESCDDVPAKAAWLMQSRFDREKIIAKVISVIG